jgi:hypothetical protein
MRSIGSVLIFLGAGSAVLHFIGYEFKLLMWIDNWGDTIGWCIRGALVAVGGGMIFLDKSSARGSDSENEDTAEQPNV